MHRFRTLVLSVATLALVAALAACGGPSVKTGLMTQQQAEQSVGQTSADFSQLASQTMSDDTFTALSTFTTFGGVPLAPTVLAASRASGLAGVAALSRLAAAVAANSQLPRGEYDYSGGTWTENSGVDTNGALVLKADVPASVGGTVPATLTLDWGTTVALTDTLSSPTATVEAPTAMTVTLILDGATAADLDLGFDWASGAACSVTGDVAQLDGLSVDGTLGDSSELTFTGVGFQIASDAITTSGTLDAASGGDSASLDWDVSLSGTTVRDPSTCGVADFQLASGDLTFASSSTVGGDSHSSSFQVGFDNLVYDGTTNALASVDLDGSATVDGRTAFTFSGPLDDLQDPGTDGVPGAHVIVTYSDGSSTLEALIEAGNVPMAAFSALR